MGLHVLGDVVKCTTYVVAIGRERPSSGEGGRPLNGVIARWEPLDLLHSLGGSFKASGENKNHNLRPIKFEPRVVNNTSRTLVFPLELKNLSIVLLSPGYLTL